MADNTVDTLELRIESEATKAVQALNKMASALGEVKTVLAGIKTNNLSQFADLKNGLKDATKSMDELKKASKNAVAAPKMDTKQIETQVNKLRERFKNIGKDFTFTGNSEEARKEIASLEKTLARLSDKEKKSITLGKVDTSSFEALEYDISFATNKLNILREYLDSLPKEKPHISLSLDDDQVIEKIDSLRQKFKDEKNGFVFTGDASQLYEIIDKVEDRWNGLLFKEGRMVYAGNIDTAEFEELQREISKTANTLDILREKRDEFFENFEAVGSIEEPAPHVPFENFINDEKKSEDSVKEFKDVLDSLRTIYPEVNEEGLDKLQNKLKSVQNELAKTRYELEKGLRFGDIDIGDKKYQQYEIKTTELEFSEEALKRKIEEVTENIARKSEEAKNAFESNLSNLKAPEINETNLDKLHTRLEKEEANLKKYRTDLENGITMGRIKVDIDDSGYRKAREQIALTEKTIEALNEKINEVGGGTNAFQKLKDRISGLQNVGGKIKNTFSKLASAFKNFAAAAKSAGSLIGKAGKSILGLRSANEKNNVSLAGGFKTILKYAFGIRSLYILINKLKSAMVEGYGNLAQYSSTVNGSISSVLSSLNALKNALAAAFAPILNVVAPYISAFIDMLTSAANAVARFFAALTGKKIATQAVKTTTNYAAGLADVGSAAGNATDGVKDLDKALSVLGFDELNQLTEQPKSSGGSSGGGGAGGSGSDISPMDMFEDVPIESAISEWAERIRKAFYAEDWQGLGEVLADGLNKGLQKVYDAISWDNVGPKITYFVNAFTQSFNSLVDNLDWDLLGRTIGTGFNTIVNTLNLLIEGIDWINLGKSFANGIMGIVNEVNWKNLGNLLGNAFMIAWETLYGFVSNLDFKELGLAIADVIKGAVEKIDFKLIAKSISKLAIGILTTLSTAVQNVDWQSVGKKVAEGLASVDWSGIADALFEALGSVLGGLAAFLWGLIEEAWNSVVEWWHDVAYEDGEFTIQGLLDGIVEALKNIGEWIKENIFDPFIDGFKEAFGISSPSKVMEEMGKFLIEGLLNGINSLIDNILSIFENIKEKITEIWDKVKSSLSNIWTSIKTQAGKLFSAVKTTISNAWSAVKKTTSNVWNNIKSTLSNTWSNLKSSVSSAFDNMKNTVSSAWSNVKQSTVNTWNNIKSNLGNTWSNLKTTASNTWSSMKTTVGNAWNNIKSVTSSTWSDLKSTTSSAWSSLKTTITNSTSGIRSGIQSAFSGIQSSISSVWKNVSSSTTSAWKNISNTASSYARNMSSTIRNAFSGLASSISSVFSKIGSWASSTWSSIKRTFSSGINIRYSTSTSSIRRYANGGFLPSYAAGGFASTEIWGMNESGNPEMIGKLGNGSGKTAVANNAIISDAIEGAVERAMMRVMMNSQQNPVNVTCYAELKTENDEVLARAVTRGQQKIDYRMNPTPQYGY